MLRADDNEILTKVGPGTPMGDLLRRYWTPACLSAEIPDEGGAPARVRLLGENLVAFRDTTGRVGLVQENCPHRGASLYFGRNEGAALRCVYHGWAFDADGRCVDMPSEPAPFCEKVRMRAYPTRESGGIVWAYLGPRESVTPFRDFGTEGHDGAEFVAMKQHTTCNWVQAMEGNIDTAHISHLHQFDGIDDLPDDGSDKPGYPSNMMSWKFWRHDRAPRLELEETWYGFRYAGVRTTPNGNTHVRITAYAIPYSTMVASIPFSVGQGMFIPIDDENCWRYFLAPKDRARYNPRGLGGANLFSFAPFTTPMSAYATGIQPRAYTAGNDYQVDRDYQRHGIFSGVSDFVSQDLMVTESMGPVYDRTQEQLGSTDRAISKMRHLLISAARNLAAGTPPPAVTGDFASIRGAEKILEPDEDWRALGTSADPVVQEALG